jgi:hypothetical protein
MLIRWLDINGRGLLTGAGTGAARARVTAERTTEMSLMMGF